MTTEIFQWAVVILLVLIWLSAASSKHGEEHLKAISDQLWEMQKQGNKILDRLELFDSLYDDVSDIQVRMRIHFQTEEEEREESLRSQFS